ncbi:hypothetical protein GSI_09669 [Ganoderma sinense ZZ0214-1]|uniref:Transporter n=1 Tax=Ganoderma sinense ZZ0214-1 TaxID=1077348 RepID=A0A2G8S3E8_9APHY|nr:hypothetical protein GSI_09669 [Ganoderma sinense ZZ0214-1]
MPAFHRLLVLSVLALALSVQAAPLGAVESREFGNVSGLDARGFRPKHKGSAGSGHATEHVGHGHYGRDVEEDTLEARRFKIKPKHSAGSGPATEHVGHGHHGRDFDEEGIEARRFRPKHKGWGP